MVRDLPKWGFSESLHTLTHPTPEVCLALTPKDFIFSCNSTENSPEFLSLLLEQEFYYQEAMAQTEVGPRVRVLSLLDSSSCGSCLQFPAQEIPHHPNGWTHTSARAQNCWLWSKFSILVWFPEYASFQPPFSSGLKPWGLSFLINKVEVIVILLNFTFDWRIKWANEEKVLCKHCKLEIVGPLSYQSLLSSYCLHLPPCVRPQGRYTQD